MLKSIYHTMVTHLFDYNKLQLREAIEDNSKIFFISQQKHVVAPH